MEFTTGLIKELPAGTPVLSGRLSWMQPAPEMRPRLQLSAWCPFCHAGHFHNWPEPPFTVETVVQVKAPCAIGPWVGHYIWLVMDPVQWVHNGRVRKEFDSALKQHRLYREVNG